MTEHGIARRSLIQGAGLIGAGLLATPAAAQNAEIWSSEYWAKKGDVSLALYRKRLGAPRAGEALPAGRDTADLQWCVEQWLGDGRRRELWSSGAGLVGYVLPPPADHPNGERVGGATVLVVEYPQAFCPRLARANREGT